MMWREIFAMTFLASHVAGCVEGSEDKRPPIVIADDYIRHKDPKLLVEHPIRKIDDNANYWLIYYLPDPRGPEPRGVFGNGFIVGVEKKTGKPIFGGFQQ
ncbi:hypothetical protein [Inquilinus sp. CA228]|uniref:hypothetical protein n=1 Tax=Inquilinus sp. CA228 TaxID=3455609 RepID=UPI003F8D4052